MEQLLQEGNVFTPVCQSFCSWWVCPSMQWARGRTPGADTPSGRHPLGRHPLGRDLLGRFTPRLTPLADTPQGPLRQKPLRWPLSGLYASYCNVLLLFLNLTISLLLLVSQNIIKFMSQHDVDIVFSIPLTPYFIFEKKLLMLKKFMFVLKQ